MTPGLVKSLGSTIVGIMTFLGWNVSEYSYLLPPIIRDEIVVTETPKAEQKSDTKIIPVVVKINPEPKKETSTQPQKKSPVVATTAKPEKKELVPKQPVYYPAQTESKNVIKEEIQNLINEIIPPQSPTEVAKEKITLSIENKIKKSVVNIYCSRILGNRIQKITGSGVVIDSSGVIITNAHVAEYFLLAQSDANTSCFIRTDSPAVSSYKAKLVYLPSEWVNSNKNNLSLATLTGTGENDYALLVVTDKIRATAPSSPFPFLNPSNSNPTMNQSVFVAGYPAGFSDVKILENALYELTKPTTITNLAGFTRNTVDVINTGPTSVAEHGSSGGAVVDDQGNLVALIVATTIDNQSGNKNIQAITLQYIRNSIKNNSGESFDSLVSNAIGHANNFEKTMVPILANTLLGN